MAGMMPFYILREWDNDGKMLSGGKVFFYESGTYVPKAVYTDSTESQALPNPVILDASGSCDIWLGDGAYRVLVRDQYDVQVKPAVDGVFGTSASAGSVESNADFSTVQNYADLRMLPLAVDFVYVCGRLTAGDGGAGWFQHVPASTLTDNDGTILTSGAGSNVYSRVFDGVIDPRWFGVKYGVSIDNKIYLDHAFIASALFNYPVQITGSTFLSQNLTIPTGASIITTVDGFFTASGTVVVTFADNSHFESSGRTFGTNVSVVFGNNVVPEILVSWMGGAVDDDRLTKLLNSGTSLSPLLIDVALTGVSINLSTTKYLKFVPGLGSIAFATSLALTLSVPNLVPIAGKMFDITATTVVTSIDFGSQHARPEWFGANGLIATNQYRELYYCIKTGKVELSAGKTYSALTAFPALPATLSVKGNQGTTLNLGSGIAITNTNTTLQDVTVSTVGTFNWLTCSTFSAYQSNFPSTYTVSVAQEIDGCSYTDKPFGDVPVFNGRPQLYNAHLPLLPYAPNLRTDSVGKIYSDYKFPYGLTNWNIECSEFSQNKDWTRNSIGADATNIFSPSNISSTNSIVIKNKFDDSPMLKTTYAVPSAVNQGFGYYCQGIKYNATLNKYVGFWQTQNSATSYANIIMTSTNLLSGTWTQIYISTYTANNLTAFDNILQANDGVIWTSIHNTNTFLRVSAAGVVSTFTYAAQSYIFLCHVNPLDSTKLVTLTSNALNVYATVAVSSNSGTSWLTYSHGGLINYFDACSLDNMNNVMVCGSNNASCSIWKFTNFPTAPIAIEFDSNGVGLTSGNIIKGIDYYNGTIITNGNTNAIYTSVNGGYNFTRKYQGSVVAPSFSAFNAPSLYVPEVAKIYVSLPYQQIVSGN
jgi:hypothetical protein